MTLDATERNASESKIKNGEIGYLFRMFCGHLHEAGSAFRGLDEMCRRRIDTLLAADPAGTAARDGLRAVYGTGASGSELRAILGKIRSNAAFHYHHMPFAEALQEYTTIDCGPGELVMNQYRGLSRYVVADTLTTLIARKSLGGRTSGTFSWKARRS